MSMRGDSEFNLLSDREYSVVLPAALGGTNNANDYAMNVPTSFDHRAADLGSSLGLTANTRLNSNHL